MIDEPCRHGAPSVESAFVLVRWDGLLMMWSLMVAVILECSVGTYLLHALEIGLLPRSLLY